MASVGSELRWMTRRCLRSGVCRSNSQLRIPRSRSFRTFPRVHAAKLGKVNKCSPSRSLEDSMTPHDRALYDALSSAEKDEFDKAARALDEHMNSPAVRGRLSAFVANEGKRFAAAAPEPSVTFPREPDGFFREGEDLETLDDIFEEDEFQGDDMSPMAHAELEQHREARHYARLAAWELPLLSKLAKPFTPPEPDHPLRFRYTTYMGEAHPAERKVVVEFCTKDLPELTEQQRIKLIKLVGVRYNPNTDIVKMSCEQFPTPAQNKRFLGDLIDRLIVEAKDPTDTFEDIPLDYRHVKEKKKPKFPVEWYMTPARRAELDAARRNEELEEKQRIEKGTMVDGASLVQTAIDAFVPKQIPVMAESAKSK